MWLRQTGHWPTLCARAALDLGFQSVRGAGTLLVVVPLPLRVRRREPHHSMSVFLSPSSKRESSLNIVSGFSIRPERSIKSSRLWISRRYTIFAVPPDDSHVSFKDETGSWLS